MLHLLVEELQESGDDKARGGLLAQLRGLGAAVAGRNLQSRALRDRGGQDSLENGIYHYLF